MVPDDQYIDLSGWFPVGSARLLRSLIREHDVKTVLEIGTFCGLSTLFFALECERVTTIDTFAGDPKDKIFSVAPVLERVENQRAIVDGNLEAFGVSDKVEILTGKSHDILDKMRGRRFDLIYIDGAHDFESVYGDIYRTLPMAKKVLCGDDYSRLWAEVRQAVDTLVPDASKDQWLWYKVINRSNAVA